MKKKSKTPNNADSEVTLNERQKDIFAEEELPTDYEELNITQKAAIVAIEEMLCETEEKYGISFSYISYSDGYANLIAKPVFILRLHQSEHYIYKTI